jgi:hypothetical protein
MAEEQRIGVEEAIRTLRAELTAAMLEGEGQQLQFRPGPIELEFLVQVSREKGGDAGVKFWVISIGGSAKATSSTTHRIKLTLNPITPEDKDAEIYGHTERPA